MAPIDTYCNSTDCRFVISDKLWDGGFLRKVPFHTKIGRSPSKIKDRFVQLRRQVTHDSCVKVAVVGRDGLCIGKEYVSFPFILAWCDASSYISTSKRQWKEIRLSSVLDIKCGYETQAFCTHAAKNGASSLPHASLCFSLICRERTVDFCAESIEDAQCWFSSLNELLEQTKRSNAMPGRFAAQGIQNLKLPSTNLSSPWKPTRSLRRSSPPISTISKSSKYWELEENIKPLFMAARQGNVDIVADFLHRGCPVDIFEDDIKSDTILIAACRMGKVNIVKIALEGGAKNDPHPAFGQTALQAAVSGGNIDCARLILETAAQSGANKIIVNHEDDSKEAPILVAARCGNMPMLKLLLDHGSSLLLIDAQGRTCLHSASLGGHLDCLLFLLSIDVDDLIDEKDHYGYTSLHLSIKANRVECARALLETAADYSIVTPEGYSAFEMASSLGRHNIASILLKFDDDAKKKLDLLSNTSSGKEFNVSDASYWTIFQKRPEKCHVFSNQTQDDNGLGRSVSVLPIDVGKVEQSNDAIITDQENHFSSEQIDNAWNLAGEHMYSFRRAQYNAELHSTSVRDAARLQLFGSNINIENVPFEKVDQTTFLFGDDEWHINYYDGHQYFFRPRDGWSVWDDPRNCESPQRGMSESFSQVPVCTEVGEETQVLRKKLTTDSRIVTAKKCEEREDSFHEPISCSRKSEKLPTSMRGKLTREIEKNSKRNHKEENDVDISSKCKQMNEQTIEDSGIIFQPSIQKNFSDVTRECHLLTNNLETKRPSQNHSQSIPETSRSYSSPARLQAGLADNHILTHSQLSANEEQTRLIRPQEKVIDMEDRLKMKCSRQSWLSSTEADQGSQDKQTTDAVFKQDTKHTSANEKLSSIEWAGTAVVKTSSLLYKDHYSTTSTVKKDSDIGYGETDIARSESSCSVKLQSRNEDREAHSCLKTTKHASVSSRGALLDTIKSIPTMVTKKSFFSRENDSSSLTTKEGREKEDSVTDLISCGFSDRKLQSHSEGKEAFGYVQQDKNIFTDSASVSAREVLLDAIKSRRSAIDSNSSSSSKNEDFKLANAGKDMDECYSRKNITSPDSGFVTNVQFHREGIRPQGCVQRDMHTDLDHTCVSAREALLDGIESKHSTVATTTCCVSKNIDNLKITKADRDENFSGSKIVSFESSPRTNSQSPSSGAKDHGYVKEPMCKAFDHTSITARGALLEAIKSQRSMVATTSCPLSKSCTTSCIIESSKKDMHTIPDDPSNYSKKKEDSTIHTFAHNQYNPILSKFSKMVSVGVPLSAVQHKMKQEGLSESLLTAFTTMHRDDESKEKNVISNNCQDQSSLEDNPKLRKYIKMMNVGVPVAAVILKMKSDGVEETFVHDFRKRFDADSPTRKQHLGNLSSRRSSVKMQKIHWNAIDEEKLHKSMWAGHMENEIDDEELGSLMELFCTQTRSPKNSQRFLSKRKPIACTFVDAKRGNNIAIALAQFRDFKSFDELCQSVSSFSTEKLDSEKLQNMTLLLPSHEELSKIQKYDGDICGLGRAEQWFMAVSNVPRFDQKLNSFLFYLQFGDMTRDAVKVLGVLESACKEVINNKRLASFLRKVLAIGNLMNEAAGKPKVDGITLASLLKAVKKKGVDKKTTILDHVVHTMLKQNGLDSGVLCFWDKNKSIVRDASRLNLRDIKSSLDDIRLRLNSAERTVSCEREDFDTLPGYKNENSRQFIVKCGEFLISAKASLKHAMEAMERTKVSCTSLCDYFAEDPMICETANIFQTLLTFTNQIELSKDTWTRKERAALKNINTKRKGGHLLNSKLNMEQSKATLLESIANRRRTTR